MMEHTEHTISLGFTEQRFPPGVHACQIYSTDQERQESALKFLASGLLGLEKASCFSERVHEKAVQDFFDASGISYDEVVRSGAFTLAGTREVYFKGNRFDPQRMLDLLQQAYLEARGQGYRSTRVIGEMTPEVQTIPGGESLLEYESRISLLLRQYPITAVCQYSASDFSGSMIMDILKVHPFMVVRGTVVHNPFFILPEEFLGC